MGNFDHVERDPLLAFGECLERGQQPIHMSISAKQNLLSVVLSDHRDAGTVGPGRVGIELGGSESLNVDGTEFLEPLKFPSPGLAPRDETRILTLLFPAGNQFAELL